MKTDSMFGNLLINMDIYNYLTLTINLTYIYVHT